MCSRARLRQSNSIKSVRLNLDFQVEYMSLVINQETSSFGTNYVTLLILLFVWSEWSYTLSWYDPPSLDQVRKND